jgi:hypothetical protein
VPKGVIEFLEVVDVENEERQRTLGSR